MTLYLASVTQRLAPLKGYSSHVTFHLMIYLALFLININSHVELLSQQAQENLGWLENHE